MPKSKPPSDIEFKLRATEQRYQAFIHNSLEGIWRFELDHPIDTTLPPDEQIDLVFKYSYLAEANDAMAKMYGLRRASQIVGSRLTDLMDRNVQQNIDYLRAFINSGYNLQGVESEEIDHKGRTKYFLNSLVGIIEDGKVQRAWGTQLDVTKQHQTTIALQKSQEKLRLALKVSRLGMWEWDVLSGELTWSDQLRKIYKVGAREHITYEKYMSRVHPDDRSMMQTIIQNSMKTGKYYEVEHRIIWPNGETHFILSRGQAFLENGKPIRMTGTAMNIDLRKSTEELKVKNALLSTERMELIQLNKSKDEFIALASHQLRTPATSVKQYLGMLLEGFAGDLNLSDPQLKLLQTAYESNDRQIAIINDLLLIATVDAGKIELRKKKVNIVAFVQQIIDDLRHRYAAKNQKIISDFSVASLAVSFDPVRLRMALENLLDNASKYSDEGASTTVTIKQFSTHVDISIADEGVGIDAKDFTKLFQKFSRIPNPLSTSSGGTGLGLYWAYKIIDLHDGKLKVSSAPSKGSTFTISLPS